MCRRRRTRRSQKHWKMRGVLAGSLERRGKLAKGRQLAERSDTAMIPKRSALREMEQFLTEGGGIGRNRRLVPTKEDEHSGPVCAQGATHRAEAKTYNLKTDSASTLRSPAGRSRTCCSRGRSSLGAPFTDRVKPSARSTYAPRAKYWLLLCAQRKTPGLSKSRCGWRVVGIVVD